MTRAAGMSPAERRFYEDFGKWVARERARVELSQPQLGQLVGLDRSTISCIELGLQRTLLHHAQAIIGVFAERHLGKGSVFDRNAMPGWRP